jgi:hypothetical protein
VEIKLTGSTLLQGEGGDKDGREKSFSCCAILLLYAHYGCFSVPQKKSTMQKKIPVTSNLRYMHRVLNVDEIKN